MPEIDRQGVVAPPSGVTDGGFGAVSSAFGAAAQVAGRIGAELKEAEIRKGTEQAIEDGKNAPRGTLSVPERERNALDIFRVTDEAYENVSEVLAIQRAETAAETRLAELEAEHSLDPKAFSDSAESWLKGYLGGDIPSDLAATVETSIRGELKNGLSRIATARRKKDTQEAESGLNARIEVGTEKLEKFVRANGLEGMNDPAFTKLLNDVQANYAIKAGNPAFAYSDDEAAQALSKLGENLKKTAAFKAVNDVYDAGGANEASLEQTFGIIEDIVEGFDLSSEDTQTLRTALRKEVNAKHDLNEASIGRMDKEEKLRRDTISANLAIGISRGELGLQDIEKHKSDLTPAKYAELTIKADTVREKQLKEARATAHVEGLINGQSTLNPLDTKHQNAVSSYFDTTISKQMAQSEDPIGVAVDFVSRTNIVPRGLENGIVGQLFNGEGETQVQAVNMLSAIQREAPLAFTQFPEKARRLSSFANMLMEAGQSPENAMIRARESLFTDDNVRKARNAQLSKKVLSDAVDAGIKDLEIDGFKDSVGARADYAALYEAEFLATGDEAAAQHIAQQRIQTVWGGTELFGKDQVMRHPPEKMFAVAGLSDKQNAKWMKEEFRKVLSAADADSFKTKDFVPLAKRATLVSDLDTARGDGSYAIWFTADDGFGGTGRYPLIRNGLPVRFKPDWENSSEKKRQMKAEADEIARNREIHRFKTFGEPMTIESQTGADYIASLSQIL